MTGTLPTTSPPSLLLLLMPFQRPGRAWDLYFGDDVLAAFEGYFALAWEAALRTLGRDASVVVGLAVLADRGAGLLFDRGPGHRKRAWDRVDQFDFEREFQPIGCGGAFPVRGDDDLRGDRRGRVRVSHDPVTGGDEDFQRAFLTGRFA